MNYSVIRGTLLGALALFSSGLYAKPKIDFGLFLDAYYAFDTNQPEGHTRTYSTLPTRHNEFTVNLAFLEARASADRFRSRLALQTGTSVFANYASEYRDPAKSGNQLADTLMHIQEAVAGYELFSRDQSTLWIDAGIFLSHIGLESFISRDNWNYSRSLIADFSPYYQSGVRLSYDVDATWSFQLHLINGWQNMVENNEDKSLGTQIVYRPTRHFSLTHNSLLGRESELRLFQDLIAKLELSPNWETALSFDFGLQRRPSSSAFANWSGMSWQTRWKWDEKSRFAVRAEYYSDPDGVIAPTGTAANFQAFGGSLNWDRSLTPELVWRTEMRWIRSQDAIFPTKSGTSRDTVFGTTSFALTL